MAATMFGYAPQRQRLPLIHSRICASFFAWPSLMQATAEQIWPGRAIAALKSIVLDESRLHRMQFVALRETFDRRDLVAFHRDREAEAGVHAPSIHQDGAGAALPVIATFLRAGQIQMLAQGIEQRRPRIERERVRLAIDL